ncbi:arylsulfatase [Virgibacillus phasianinus]|uniref:Arylsulfatase n=1 Tax=Virgibacillus phasianinus TaxID=2017483 RepID=A0A220U2B0_9BACI|nr:arylsulfatase [Virgibacillus phasianinus]ASK62197.1 arylsulfatase [Virgibacillus phasianinus]
MKPNVVLMMVDQMRGDCLSILDHPAVDTPNIDQLARDGVLYENAYSAAPSCVAARAAVLTGMSQDKNGRVGYEDKVPWNYEHTLPGEFAKAGYHTQCVGKLHVYPTRNLVGFHNVVLHDGYMHYNRFNHTTKTSESFAATDDYLNWLREKAGAGSDLTDLGLDCNASTVARPWHLAEELHPTNWVTTKSIDFLRRRDPTKPFFLNMSYVRPHPPFDPPEAFYNMYINEDLPEPSVGDWAEQEDTDRMGLNPVTAKGIVPKKRYKRAQAAYYALITHIDNQIGRFLQALQEYGVYDNTIILFASDHGELLGDHHLYRKILPYEGSAKVPLIVSDPGDNLKLEKNKKINNVVELRDIMPTLLAAADIPIPGTVNGKSVLELWKDGATANWREYIHGEHAYGESSFHYITDGKEKYIWFSQTGREQFFDLEKDPQELVNQAGNPDYQARVQQRRNQLIGELEGREEGYSDGARLVVGQTPKSTLNHLRG